MDSVVSPSLPATGWEGQRTARWRLVGADGRLPFWASTCPPGGGSGSSVLGTGDAPARIGASAGGQADSGGRSGPNAGSAEPEPESESWGITEIGIFRVQLTTCVVEPGALPSECPTADTADTAAPTGYNKGQGQGRIQSLLVRLVQ